MCVWRLRNMRTKADIWNDLRINDKLKKAYDGRKGEEN